MLDPISYRAAEKQGTYYKGWRTRAAHNPVQLQDAQFPIRVESLQDLWLIIDTMQELRFDSYMEELGGMSDDDAKQFSAAMSKLLRMQRIHFQKEHMPFDTLMSAWAAYQKLLATQLEIKTVLEIGPGCGYLSLFLADHPGLIKYTQIESCESFYLLQTMVNAACFGHRVWESALSVDPMVSDVMWHLPWWKLHLASTTRYDAIVANACLCELTDEAFDKYLDIFHSVANGRTLLLVQCPGSERFRTASSLRDQLSGAGWHINAEHQGADVLTWWLTQNANFPIGMPQPGEGKRKYDKYELRLMAAK